MNKGNILLVEDNRRINEINTRILVKEGYYVESVDTLCEANKLIFEKEIDIILLDVDMPDGDGIEFCKSIREKTDAHIIFLTSSTQHENRIQGLEVGGDDYITKPYKLDEMLIRVKAAFRRRNILLNSSSKNIIEQGNLKLNTVSIRAFINGIDLKLTPREFSILLLLAESNNKTLTAEYIYESVWKTPLIDDKNALQAIVSKLRNKLVLKNYNIRFIKGEGYVLENEDDISKL